MSRINLSSLTGSETQSHSPELSSNQSSSTPSVKQILALFCALPDSSKAEFIRQILSNSTQSSSIQTNNKPTETLESLRFPEQIYCPHCKKTNIVKRGISKQNKQRYLCKDCHHSFQATTLTTLEYTKKDFDTWIKYMECMSHQFSIRKSAHICEISIPTSFLWRHKILNTLNSHKSHIKEALSGIVEADETFFHLSFKGSRKLHSLAHRKPHRRGNSIKKRGLSYEQVCVPCAVSTYGDGYAQIGKLGSVDIEALALTLGWKIEPSSVLCSDSARAYVQFCQRFHLYHNNSGLKHVERLLNVHNPHIQHINAYHSSIKSFMFPFHGVATKYLNNYLIWFNRKRDNGYRLLDFIKKLVFGFSNTTRRLDLVYRNPIPVVA